MELSEFYGFNCMNLNSLHLLALRSHRPAIQAQRAFDAKVARGVRPTIDEVMRLVRLKGGSEDDAQDAGTKWAEAIMAAEAESS